MVGDPRDRTAYALGVAGLALALVVLLVGVCWIAGESGSPAEVITHHCGLHTKRACVPATDFRAGQDPPVIPDELWAALAALGGVFVGVLVPFPPTAARSEWSRSDAGADGVTVAVGLALVALAVVISSRALKDSIALFALGGTLLGLLVPSPARGE